MPETLTVHRWTEHGSPDERVLTRRLEAEGYDVFRWSDPPGMRYSAHAHGEDQSHWILRGALALEVGGTEYVLQAGDRDVLPAGTVHAARVVGEENVVYLIAAKRG